MKETTMKHVPAPRYFGYHVAAPLVMLIIAVFGSLAVAGPNQNPQVLPVGSNPHGMSYGEWAGAWWQWAIGIPAATNPIVDATGEFGHIDQEGSVWFLAGTFGGTAERELTIPPGKSLFFPLMNSLWWAPDDVPTAAFVVEAALGLNPDDFTDDELIRLTAIAQVSPEELEMTCTVDGDPLADLENYFADSPGFNITDTDLLDDFGAAISHPNKSVTAGYWIMLAPLAKGEHTIQFTAHGDDPFWGPFDLDMTYNITVGHP